MANVKITYARYYPVHKGQISDQSVELISSSISEELPNWTKFIYKHPENHYLDLIFESKSILEFAVFESEEVLKHFHIWLRISDEGGKNDVICFKSRHYHLNKSHVYSDPVFKHYRADTWNYVNMCLYGADSFSIHMKQFEVETVKQFIRWDSEYMDLNEQADHSWKTYLNTAYFKTNTRYIDTTGNCARPFEQDFYQRFRGEGSLRKPIYGDSRFSLDSYFIAHTDLNAQYQFERIDENILKVCLWKNGVQIHEWEWKEQTGEWEESCSADWDHCIDPEYVKFLALYEQPAI